MDSAVSKTHRRIAASAVLFCALTAAPHAQTVSSQPQASATGSQRFRSIDESLTRAADMLLVPHAPVGTPTTAIAGGNVTPAPSDLRLDPRPRPILNAAMTLASARFDLLRPIIEPILRSRGVPPSMAAVVVVESGGRFTALSPKGARGLWQLMPDTARRYGLRVDEVQDDRVDLFKSTDAAARYLHDLYAQFGDWKLALAAYNTGEGNVGVAILKAHTHNFDQLTSLRVLPLETQNYVPRVLATIRFLGQAFPFGEAHPIPPAITLFALSSP